MLKRGAWVILAAAVLVLFTPRVGTAGIGEWIWEMSGPSMVGAISGCSVSFKTMEKRFQRCSVFGVPLPPRWPKLTPPKTPIDEATETIPSTLGNMFLVLESGTYVSLAKNSGEGEDEKDFRGFHTYMLTFDPMIGFKSALGEHGVGITYNFLFGKEFSSFSNIGFKARPIILTWHQFVFEWNVRLYPNGFDVVEGSDPAALMKGDDFEWVNGIGVTWKF